ncbi:MAG: hypothetical protein K8R48_06580 [Alphaproteobacteria bacterium]|nr:hypothetical protein [Alphaproteobacteria bacterium]
MAETEAVIEYKTDAGAFKVVLTATSADVFMQAAQQQDIIIKEGEALIAALLAHAKGAISSVERFKNGRFNDGLNGEPAIQKFDSMLKLTYIRRYTDGKLNDGLNGEPAIQDFSDGRMTIAVSYKDGLMLKSLSAEEKAKCQETVDKNKTKAFLDKLKIKNPGQ